MAVPATHFERLLHRLRTGAIVLAIALGVDCLILAVKWPFTRQTVTHSIEQVVLSKVQIGRFQKVYFPHPGYIAQDVAITRDSSPGAPPLATVGSVNCRASWFAVLSLTHRIGWVRLNSVHIYVPAHVPRAVRGPGHEVIKTTVTELVADGTVLEFLPRHPNAAPLRFDFSRLTFTELARNKPIRFRTVMHTPEPPGIVAASASVGPFVRGHAGQAPASGSFHLTGADLSCFHVIAGILSSSGTFQGNLEQLQVRGNTRISNFEVTSSRHSVDVTAEYSTIVNGASGDIAVDSVHAHWLRTTIGAHGAIAGHDGKTVSLDITPQGARVEDLLRLFVTADQPPLRGPITFQARAVLPPGKQKFLEKLRLDGEFGITGAEFTHATTQSNADELSARARGEKHNAQLAHSSGDVSSDWKSDVTLRHAVATVSNASFRVPGALARGEGTYNLINEAIDLHGTLAMEASLSKAAGGIKSIFLLPLDPFFKKGNAGAVLPVRMTGTYSHPVFKVSLTGKK